MPPGIIQDDTVRKGGREIVRDKKHVKLENQVNNGVALNGSVGGGSDEYSTNADSRKSPFISDQVLEVDPLERAQFVRLDQPLPITWLHLVPGGKWLLVAASDSRYSTLSLFSVDDTLQARNGEACTTPQADEALTFHSTAGITSLTQIYLCAPVSEGFVSRHNDCITIALVLQSETPVLNILSLRLRDKKPVFVLYVKRKSLSHIRMFRGDWVGCSLYQDQNIPCLHNWKTGSTVKILHEPDLQGGCIALTWTDKHVVVVFRRKILIYSIQLSPTVTVELVQTLRPGFSAGYADICATSTIPNSDTSHPRFILTLRQEDRIFVFLIRQVKDVPHALFKLLPVSTFAGPRSVNSVDPCRPRVGATGTYLTWHTVPLYRMKFCLAPLVLPDGSAAMPNAMPSPLLRIYQSPLTNPGGVALYHHGIVDFDEVQGVAAFGNGFGELAIGQLTTTMECKSSLREICMPPLHDEEVIHEVRFPMTAKLKWPFPYMLLDRPLWDDNSAKDTTLPHDQVEIPHWQTNWRPGTWYGDLEFLAATIERRFHLYGKLTPLAQSHYHDVEVFQVGDLLLLYMAERTMHGLVRGSFEDLVAAFTTKVPIAMRRISETILWDGLDSPADLHHNWEWKNRGVNRAERLKSRSEDTDVDPLFLRTLGKDEGEELPCPYDIWNESWWDHTDDSGDEEDLERQELDGADLLSSVSDHDQPELSGTWEVSPGAVKFTGSQPAVSDGDSDLEGGGL